MQMYLVALSNIKGVSNFSNDFDNIISTPVNEILQSEEYKWISFIWSTIVCCFVCLQSAKYRIKLLIPFKFEWDSFRHCETHDWSMTICVKKYWPSTKHQAILELRKISEVYFWDICQVEDFCNVENYKCTGFWPSKISIE